MSTSWPAATWEERPWRPPEAPEFLSRSVRELTALPYRAAVLPPIAELEVPLPRAVSAAVEDASEEMRAFTLGRGGEVTPFSALLLAAESAASSRIDGLAASAQAVALSELGEETPGDARAISANLTAMRTALARSRLIDAAAIAAMHSALRRGAPAPAAVDPDAGPWRSDQTWVAGGALSPHNAAYVPPHPGRVDAAVGDLVAFAGRTDLPALTHGALVHAQFEAIHPFADGNGRVGRALLHALYRRRRLTRAVVVPLSAGLLADRAGYVDALGAYRTGDPVPIVAVVVEAARAAVANGQRLVDDLHFAHGEWRAAVHARADSSVWPLLDLLLRHPVVSTAVVRGELGLSHTNAMRSLARLADAGVVQEVGERSRSILWAAPQVLSALDAFAERARA